MLVEIHREQTASTAAQASTTQDDKTKTGGSGHPSWLAGYNSIVLWPIQPKDQIVAPVSRTLSPIAAHLQKPLVIHFDGAYWYYQAPEHEPGPNATVAHGDPLDKDIRSIGFVPLKMEAHQKLAQPVLLSCCGQVRVDVENYDNHPGEIAVEVLLTDSAAPKRGQTLYLGQQPILSSQPSRFAQKQDPVGETLNFDIPIQSPIRKFDEITVVFSSSFSRVQLGSKVAIDDFELMPR
jgi:hypothetical protein